MSCSLQNNSAPIGLPWPSSPCWTAKPPSEVIPPKSVRPDTRCLRKPSTGGQSLRLWTVLADNWRISFYPSKVGGCYRWLLLLIVIPHVFPVGGPPVESATKPGPMAHLGQPPRLEMEWKYSLLKVKEELGMRGRMTSWLSQFVETGGVRKVEIILPLLVWIRSSTFWVRLEHPYKLT